MCGIAGWQRTGASADTSAVAAMSAALAHRGPDDSGWFEDTSAGVVLAHRRLSIIDLSAASHQPMCDDASGVVLAYNGELYNYRDLRDELVALGHSFCSAGDTEVILRSYLQWGWDCLARFGGMFALALWDPRARKLHLARDAMGMKPLYYVSDADGVAFASEVKAFRSLPGFAPRVDRGALHQYLEFGYVFERGLTMLEGVHKLDPGQRLEIEDGRVVARCDWFTPPRPETDDSRSDSQRVAEFVELLSHVVQQHLIADVPVGLLLSGGIDSSLIAAMAARHGPLLTITMGFSDSAVDERGHARQVASFIGSRHVEVQISAEEVKREVLSGAWVFDDLFGDWGTITTRLLYRRCREHGIKVVLVGEGADELFGGYDVFRTPHRLGLFQQFRLYQRYAGRRWGREFGLFHRTLREHLDAVGGEPFAAVRLIESRNQLPNQYVMKVDKASMAESVEARAPYLDRRIAQCAYRTPRDWLLRGGENKYLLRATARAQQLLPDATAQRPKYGAPLDAAWLDTDPAFRSFARTTILDGTWSRAAGVHHAMASYFDRDLQGFAFPRAISVFRNLAWRMLLLELWAPHYVAA